MTQQLFEEKKHIFAPSFGPIPDEKPEVHEFVDNGYFIIQTDGMRHYRDCDCEDSGNGDGDGEDSGNGPFLCKNRCKYLNHCY